MGYSFDYFVGNLRCSVCQAVSDADETTNMQTYIRSEPQMELLGVRHPLKIDLGNIEERGYLTIQTPVGQTISILHTWECPTCGSPFNWAKIVVENEVITNIKEVHLNRAAFEQSHLISTECISVVSDLTGYSFSELAEADLVKILWEKL